MSATDACTLGEDLMVKRGLVSRKNTDNTTMDLSSMSVSRLRVENYCTCAASSQLNHRGKKFIPSAEQLVSASEGPIATSQPDL